jgi:ribosomal protein L30
MPPAKGKGTTGGAKKTAKRTPKKKSTKAAKAAAGTKKSATTKAKATKAKAPPARATKSPAKAANEPRPAKAAGSAGRLRVRQVRSDVRRAATLRLTLRALGIKHHQDEVVVTDNPAIRGMLHKVHHLVRVTPEES